MDRVLADALWELSLYRWLIGLFAALVLLLTAVGLYGVIGYGVAARTREFAIRLALGSGPVRLARLVLAHALGLAATGLVLGAVAAALLAPSLLTLSTVLHARPTLYVAIGGLLVAITLAACLGPILRVVRLDGAGALRSE